MDFRKVFGETSGFFVETGVYGGVYAFSTGRSREGADTRALSRRGWA